MAGERVGDDMCPGLDRGRLAVGGPRNGGSRLFTDPTSLVTELAWLNLVSIEHVPEQLVAVNQVP